MSLVDLPFRTFADIARLGLEVRVHCTRCNSSRRVEIPASHADRLFAGQRFRCHAVGREFYGEGERVCGDVGTLSIDPPEGRHLLPGAGVRHVDLYCKRCMPYWQLRWARHDDPTWSAAWGTPAARYRCPGCRGPVSTLYGGGGATPYTEGYTTGQPSLR